MNTALHPCSDFVKSTFVPLPGSVRFRTLKRTLTYRTKNSGQVPPFFSEVNPVAPTERKTSRCPEDCCIGTFQNRCRKTLPPAHDARRIQGFRDRLFLSSHDHQYAENSASRSCKCSFNCSFPDRTITASSLSGGLHFNVPGLEVLRGGRDAARFDPGTITLTSPSPDSPVKWYTPRQRERHVGFHPGSSPRKPQMEKATTLYGKRLRLADVPRKPRKINWPIK